MNIDDTVHWILANTTVDNRCKVSTSKSSVRWMRIIDIVLSKTETRWRLNKFDGMNEVNRDTRRYM